MCRKMVFMPFRIWQMQLEFFLTGICLKNMAGRFQPHGMNLLLCVKESKLKEFSRCILDSKIPGPVWLRGMRSL